MLAKYARRRAIACASTSTAAGVTSPHAIVPSEPNGESSVCLNVRTKSSDSVGSQGSHSDVIASMVPSAMQLLHTNHSSSAE